MSREIEALCYGEALVDFLPARPGRLREVEAFTRVSGGAPANVALGCARLGCVSGLLGKVGEDEFGWFLHDTLREAGVRVEGLLRTREAKTGIAFVALDASGDRSFMFYREPSADMTVRAGELDLSLYGRAEIAVFGSNLLCAPTAREATLEALAAAEAAGCLLVVDPNVRLHIWPSPDEARAQVEPLVARADVLKLNEEELGFLAGASTDAAARALLARLPRCLALVVTRAAQGAAVFTRRHEVAVPAPSIEVVDTTGAGDGALAALVAGLCALRRQRSARRARALVLALSAQDWHDLLTIACASGTRVCTALGATTAQPTLADLPQLAALS